MSLQDSRSPAGVPHPSLLVFFRVFLLGGALSWSLSNAAAASSSRLFCRVKCFCFWTVRALCKRVVRQQIKNSPDSSLALSGFGSIFTVINMTWVGNCAIQRSWRLAHPFCVVHQLAFIIRE